MTADDVGRGDADDTEAALARSEAALFAAIDGVEAAMAWRRIRALGLVVGLLVGSALGGWLFLDSGWEAALWFLAAFAAGMAVLFRWARILLRDARMRGPGRRRQRAARRGWASRART